MPALRRQLDADPVPDHGQPVTRIGQVPHPAGNLCLEFTPGGQQTILPPMLGTDPGGLQVVARRLLELGLERGRPTKIR